MIPCVRCGGQVWELAQVERVCIQCGFRRYGGTRRPVQRFNVRRGVDGYAAAVATLSTSYPLPKATDRGLPPTYTP